MRDIHRDLNVLVVVMVGGGGRGVGGGRERERGRGEGGRERQSITQTNSCRDRVTGTIKLWEARGGIIK